MIEHSAVSVQRSAQEIADEVFRKSLRLLNAGNDMQYLEHHLMEIAKSCAVALGEVEDAKKR